MAGLNEINDAELAAQFPLHHACKVGDVETVKHLLEINGNASLIEDTLMNWTPAHWAAYFGKLDCLKYATSLLVNGVNIQTSKTCVTPSHSAAEAGHANCLLWLLHFGANVNIKDFSGETPLHKCARTGSMECVSLLIAASADLRIINIMGDTAVMVAEHNGHQAIAVYIHQAELVRELGGNIFDQHQSAHRQPCRKRRLDCGTFNNYSKRVCTDASPVMTESSQMDLMSIDGDLNASAISQMSSPVTTSVIDHEKLQRMEFGYRNCMFQCMINQFHGF